MHNVTRKSASAQDGKTKRAYGYLMHLHSVRIRAIWDACNSKDDRLDGLHWSSKLAQCHVGEYIAGPYIGVSKSRLMARNGKFQRRSAGYTGVVQCSNAFCPLCGPRLMSKRCEEIGRAVKAHLHRNEPSALYMLTFTVRHQKGDSLRVLRDGLSNALEAFGRDGTVRRIFAKSGVVGRIRSLECQYGRENGYHPHSHNLYFASRGLTDGEIDQLSLAWRRCCVASKMDSSYERGLNYRLCDTHASDYLTKIKGEIVLGNITKLKGEKSGHYNPMQLLQLAADGENWAKQVYIDEVLSFRGMRLTHWSRGLKELYHIEDISDDEAVAEFDRESETVARISKMEYYTLPWRSRGDLLDVVCDLGISEAHLKEIGVEVVPADDGSIPELRKFPELPWKLIEPNSEADTIAPDCVGSGSANDCDTPELPFETDIVPYPVAPLGRENLIPHSHL